MLETQIDEKVWKAVQKNYEGRSFSEAIIDSVYYLSNLIRDKTGLESDGVALIGQAFGGTQPHIKVNALQTESEVNIQKGLEQILRGIYQAIRNPRSHDRYNDSQKDADAIIIFIDYLCNLIDQSKTQFSDVDFLNRVFDSNFVESERYAELLVEEIPKRKRLNFAIEVYKKKETGEGKKITYFMNNILAQLSNEELEQFYEVVSDELLIISNENTIRYTLQILPLDNWHRIKEVARIRIENIIMESIKNGKYLRELQKTNGGWLATWVSYGKVKHLTFVQDIISMLIRKLDSSDNTEIDYVLHFFWDDILYNIEHPNHKFNRIIKQKLKQGDKRFYDALAYEFDWSDPDDESILVKTLKEDFENFVEKEQTIDISDDDLPF